MLAGLCLMEGGTTLLSESRLGPHAAPAELPCTPGLHGPRPSRLCLLSFPVGRRLRASASPLLFCVWLFSEREGENLTEVSPVPRPSDASSGRASLE